jgi:hypothetical protein
VHETFDHALRNRVLCLCCLHLITSGLLQLSNSATDCSGNCHQKAPRPNATRLCTHVSSTAGQSLCAVSYGRPAGCQPTDNSALWHSELPSQRHSSIPVFLRFIFFPVILWPVVEGNAIASCRSDQFAASSYHCVRGLIMQEAERQIFGSASW